MSARRSGAVTRALRLEKYAASAFSSDVYSNASMDALSLNVYTLAAIGMSLRGCV